MSDLQKIVSVTHHNNIYTLVGIQISGQTIPVLLDHHIYRQLRAMPVKWYINPRNHVYCRRYADNRVYHVYMHDLITRLSLDSQGKSTVRHDTARHNTAHHNTIHFDNRIANLLVDIPEKQHNKSTQKKRRTISLDPHGIDTRALPTYVWYMKPDQTHGGRFVVDLPDTAQWRSTASTKLSHRYKLETAKKYLREMKQHRPDIFANYSMNGQLTARGQQLFAEYKRIIEKAGYTINTIPNTTDMFLEENLDGLAPHERELLGSQ